MKKNQDIHDMWSVSTSGRKRSGNIIDVPCPHEYDNAINTIFGM
jgi:hypothetical protein